MAAGGLVLGLAAAWAGLRLFAAMAAGVMPPVDAVALDLPVVIAGLVLTLLAGAACGGASAAGAVRGDGGVLRGGAAATGSRTTRRLREGLVAAQIALSIVLLTGARTGWSGPVDRLLDEDGGFEPRQALTARLMLADRPLIEGDDHNAFVETLLDRVRGLPGVQAAGVGSLLPPDDEPISVQFVYDIGERLADARDRPVVRRGHPRLLRGAGRATAGRAPVRRRRRLRRPGPRDAERDRRAFRLPGRGRGWPSDVLQHRCPCHRASRAYRRRRRRHEVPGARRPARGYDIRPVAAGAHRRVVSRGSDHRRSDGLGPGEFAT